ncbi:hypothetical protein ElyMa_002278000 [Elysia marginata]|uniref:CTNNB1 binding N-teminal domain-containing protein n=1 Tax=Elysia marginata TaxID=1093978 RepID=A0AAV4FZX4_9GAST|nr:hypothetical protein ElyMa_002278000 [Elysia marginata]
MPPPPLYAGFFRLAESRRDSRPRLHRLQMEVVNEEEDFSQNPEASFEDNNNNKCDDDNINSNNNENNEDINNQSSHSNSRVISDSQFNSTCVDASPIQLLASQVDGASGTRNPGNEKRGPSNVPLGWSPQVPGLSAQQVSSVSSLTCCDFPCYFAVV